MPTILLPFFKLQDSITSERLLISEVLFERSSILKALFIYRIYQMKESYVYRIVLSTLLRESQLIVFFLRSAPFLCFTLSALITI